MMRGVLATLSAGPEDPARRSEPLAMRRARLRAAGLELDAAAGVVSGLTRSPVPGRRCVGPRESDTAV